MFGLRRDTSSLRSPTFQCTVARQNFRDKVPLTCCAANHVRDPRRPKGSAPTKTNPFLDLLASKRRHKESLRGMDGTPHQTSQTQPREVLNVGEYWAAHRDLLTATSLTSTLRVLQERQYWPSDLCQRFTVGTAKQAADHLQQVLAEASEFQNDAIHTWMRSLLYEVGIIILRCWPCKPQDENHE